MKSWQEDLLNITGETVCEHAVMKRLEAAAIALGFEHCAYGLRAPLPLSNPRTIILNNYPVAWQVRYGEQGYVAADPIVLHGRRSRAPVVWSDEVFSGSLQLWDEARAHGLCHGWSQSTLDRMGVGGMLSLSRSASVLTPSELAAQEVKMRWLSNIAHVTLSRIFAARLAPLETPALTAREIEILKWTGDGKTSGEISSLLAVSENTVNFHVKNAVGKLGTANKTAAVVRAAMLGLLN